MTNILNKSVKDAKQIDDLLGKSIPSHRQAYSDRTAWIMACLSELAYIRFNPLFAHGNQERRLIDKIEKLVGESTQKALVEMIGEFAYDHNEEKANLEDELGIMKIELVETFDSGGTQAILVSSNEFIALAFRGTEKKISDIKADIKAKITHCETDGKMHMGFKEAFEEVAVNIQKKLNKDVYKDKPLFITGHSLGGALATVATKKLSHRGGIAACYTFGSPRVGNTEWIAGIKSPIYRVVNAADCVPMLPPGQIWIDILCFIGKYLPYVGESFSSWLSKFGGYLHCGDMRYLTNCNSGEYDDVKLLFYVNLVYRIKGLLKKQFPGKKLLMDHSMKTYRKKLMMVARNRNKT